MPHDHQPLPFTSVAAACEASTAPLIWSEAWCLEHDRLRLERDAARVRHDVDRLPQGPLGSELGRRWWASVQRRDEEARVCRSRLERLAAVAGAVVASAVTHARACDGRWLEVPGGSVGDG
jgi:hypothetical protein